MTEKEISPPEWPKPDKDTEAAIGRFIIAWGVLEREIDQAIEDIYRLDSDLALSITANLGTKAKLEIFQSAIHCLDDVFGTTIVAVADKLVNDTTSTKDQYRNFFAHGQPFALDVSPDAPWAWVKLSARKGGVKGHVRRLTPEIADKATAATRSLIERWYALRRNLADGIRLLNELDRGF